MIGSKFIHGAGVLLAMATAAAAMAQEQPATSAREAVRLGNEKLRTGDPGAALKFYEQAGSLEPDALEIDFVEGLAHFHAQEYPAALEAFERAAAAGDAALGQAAMYSAGTALHAEALADESQPEIAIEKLEAAMQRYQGVLAADPGHSYARDGLRKAATMRQLLKRRMEQQEQQQQSSQDDKQKESNEEQQQQQESSGEKNEQNESESQEQQSSEQQQDQKEASQEQTSQSEQQQGQDGEQNQQEQDSRKEAGEDQAQEQPDASETGEDQEVRNSREQAERRLREMMQHVRTRQKQREESVQRVPVVPVDKDW